jgi:hypothetical protein
LQEQDNAFWEAFAMTPLWIATFLLAAAPEISADSETTRTTEKITAALDSARSTASTQDATSKKGDESPLFSPRKPAEMRTAVSNAMRATATAKEPAARDAAIRKLILIMLEVEQDRNLTREERVALRTLVHSRLTTLERSLRAESKRTQGQGSAHQEQSAGSRTSIQAKSLGQVAAQSSLGDAAAKREVTELAPQVLGQIVNGPAINPRPGAFNQPVGNRNPAIGNRNVAQAADNGADLVQLIQTVIAPRTWDVNGGPSSIVYYRNLQALVVRAPSDVHSRVGNTLGQLRK